MNNGLAVQGVVYVEALRVVQLQSTACGREDKILLQPGPHEFYIVNFDDGRPEEEWAVLINNKDFGTPTVRLRALDRSGTIEVTDKNGKRHYHD